jgi:hypothetical protein
MLGAISAAHHGWLIFPADCASRGFYFLDVGCYVGLVRFSEKNLTMQNGVKLVRRYGMGGSMKIGGKVLFGQNLWSTTY